MQPLRSVLDPRSVKALQSLGITTVDELLAHYPRRYEDPARLTELAGLRVGERVTVLARVGAVTSRTLARRPGDRRARTITEAVVTDGTGRLTLTFFNQQWGVEKNFRPGRLGLFAGTVGEFKGQRQLLHPRHRFVDEDTAGEVAQRFADRLIPVYPATEKEIGRAHV